MSLGFSSSDLKNTGSLLRVLYSISKDTICNVTSDAFTQSNPASVTAPASVSTTLALNHVTKRGALSGSVAFLRGDLEVGGPDTSWASGHICVPMGLFLNDAVGNAYENTPAVASGKNTVLRGGVVSIKVYETQALTNPYAALDWKAGDKVYASANGLLTNRAADSHEVLIQSGTATVMGIVLSAPSATSGELVVKLNY